MRNDGVANKAGKTKENLSDAVSCETWSYVTAQQTEMVA
jgi:hypothetical protein